jgi:RHS repeat-associated protein
VLASCISATALAQKAVVYYLSDPQGTPLAEADAAGNVTATFDYRPYGAQSLGLPVDGVAYTGHVADADTALTYMQQRYYDPNIGRFLSSDPVGPSAGATRHFNRYEYGYDNPYRFKDTDGRCPVCALVVAGVSLYTVSDYANAPGIEDKPVSMTPAEKMEAVAGALPGPRAFSVARSAVRAADNLSSRQARREAERKAGIPTSRSATSQSGQEGQRQYVKEGSDGTPAVVTQHPADAQHDNPHWHAANAKVDPVSGEVRQNNHGQVKYESGGPAVEYVEHKEK